MAVRRITQGAGLVTDPSALEAPQMAKGAMRTATNVMAHRPGVLQPRPGFGDTAGITNRTGNYRPLQAITFGGDMVVVSFDEDLTPDGFRFERLSADTQYTGGPSDVIGGSDASTVTGRMALMKARRNLYVQGEDGMMVLDAIGGNFTRAGVWMTFQPPSFALVSAASTDRIAVDSSSADSQVAYRWVVLRVDANGYEKRSAPSSRLIVEATNAGFATGAYVNLSGIFLPASGLGWHAVAGDIIEIYRTPNTASPGDPGEDYYLAATHSITSAEVAATQTASNIVDDTPDALLGVALYSSSSQKGSLAAKLVNPNGHALAYWGDVAWLGGTIERSVQRLAITKVGSANDGLGHVAGTCASSTGTQLGTVVLTAAEWLTLRVGQWLSGTSGPNNGTSSGVPAGTKITAFDSSLQTIDVDTAVTATTAFSAGDILSVGTSGSEVDYYFYSSEALATRWIIMSTDATHSDAVRITAESAVRIITVDNGRVYVIKDHFPDGNGDGEFLILDVLPEQTTGDPGLSMSVTKEACTVPDIFTTRLVDPDDRVHPNRIQYSELGEPEAWPPANFFDVGTEESYVMALVPLTEALIVFKEDGVWRITGSGPHGWVVDKIGSHRLIASECTCVLDDVCYAWTDRGVIRMTEGGIAPEAISAPIAHTLRELQRICPDKNRNYKHGFYMVSHQRLGLVIVASADTAAAEVPARWHVWHRSTGAWTQWSRTDAMCAYDEDEDRLVVGLAGDKWFCFYERNDEDAAASYHDQNTDQIVPSSWTSTTVVVLAISDVDFLPDTCSVVEFQGDTTTYHTVTNVVNNSGGAETYVLTLSPAVDGTANVIVYQGIEATMLWQAQHLPGYGSQWQELHAQLLDGASAYLTSWTLEVGGQTHRDASPADVDATIASDVTLSRPVRVGLPRECVRAAHLYPYAKVCTAGVLWRLAELQLHATGEDRRAAP